MDLYPKGVEEEKGLSRLLQPTPNLFRMMRYRFAIIIMTTTITACGPRADDRAGARAPTLAPLSATEILNRLAEHYAALQEYEDAGEVLRGPGHDSIECLSFATIFRRAQEIRFRFNDGCRDPRTVGFSGSGGTTTGIVVAGDSPHTVELPDAIQELGGITLGTSRYVPALLHQYDAFGLKGPSTRILRSDVVPCGFEMCYVVELTLTPYQHRELTIDSRFTLRALKDVFRRADGDESHISVRFTPLKMK
jgi:hypothetical protein